MHFESDESESGSCSVLSALCSPWTVVLCPWDFCSKNTGVDSHSLLQGIGPDPGIESRSPALQADFLLSEPPGKPIVHVR